MYRYILFDLDGTLTDPKIGICTSVQYALEKMGIVEEDIDKLEPFIGPPLDESFKEFYGFDDDQCKQAIAYYRERFSVTGLFENEVYPGIPELLRDLKKKDRVVAIASSKPTEFVERILEHFEIRQYFDFVVGATFDGTLSKKEDILNEALRQMFEDAEPDYEDTVMIGDRKFDIEAALKIGTHNIGVSYGYGSREELEEAGADRIVNTVAGLRNVLLPIMGMQVSQVEARPSRVPNMGDDADKAKASDQTPVDWKSAGKEASKQSFANMWGMFGAPLIFFLVRRLGWSLTQVGLSMLAKDNEPMLEFLESNIFMFYFGSVAVASLLTILFVKKEFKLLFDKGFKDKYPGIQVTDEKRNLKPDAPADWKKGWPFVIVATIAATIISIGLYFLMENLNEASRLANEAAMAAQAAAETEANVVEAVTDVAETTAEQAVSMAVVLKQIPLWFAILTFGMIIPIVEEIIFRAIAYNHARRQMSAAGAVFMMGLVFAFLNGEQINDFYAFGVGITVGYAYSRFHDIRMAMFIHVVISTVLLLIIRSESIYTALMSGKVYMYLIGAGILMFLVYHFVNKKVDNTIND